jgi:hypothetical protein
MRPLLTLAVAAGLGLSACASTTSPSAGGPNDGAANQPNSSAPANSSPAAAQRKIGSPKASPRKAAAPKPMSCDRVRGGTEGKFAQLVDVRVGTHDGYDRVTFEFAPSSDGGQYFGLPPYEIHSVMPPITEDPSGEPMSVDGSHFATVVFHGGTGVEFTEDAEDGYILTYTGPREFQPGFPALAETSRMGDFEATLSWVFGLNRDSCLRVHELEGPVRLAIDFPHD